MILIPIHPLAITYCSGVNLCQDSSQMTLILLQATSTCCRISQSRMAGALRNSRLVSTSVMISIIPCAAFSVTKEGALSS